MNGFLDTLAARALAPTTAPLPPGAVRPQVRTRFEPEPASVLGALPAIEESIEHSWADEAPAPAARATSSIPVRAEPKPERRQLPAVTEPSRLAHPDRPGAVPVATPALAPVISAPPASPPLPAATLQPAARVAPSLPPLIAPPAAAAAALAAPRGQQPPDTQQTPQRAVAAPTRTEPGSVDRASAAVPTEPTPALSAALPGTLQPAPIAARVVTGALAEPARAPQSERGREGHDPDRAAVKRPSEHTVHVSIGRIEIRASAPARAPARQERTGPQPLGLDDYLRQHARGDKP